MSTSGAKVDPRVAGRPEAAAAPALKRTPTPSGAARSAALGDALFAEGTSEADPTPAPTPIPETARVPAGASAAAKPTTATGRAAAARMAAPLVTWPRNVPSAVDGLNLLTGKKQDTAANAALVALRKELSPAEDAAVVSAAPEHETLRQAVTMRFRLALALERKPVLGARFEDAGVEKLLSEADAVLTTLQAPDDAAQEIIVGFGSARAALARDAVALSEFARTSREVAAKEEKAARVARAAAAPTQAVQSMTIDGGAERSGPPRQLWMGLLLGVLLIGAGFFHALRWRELSNFTPPPPGLPAGAAGRVDARTGVGIFHVSDGRLDAAKLQQLRAETEAKGMVLKEVGPGTYVILPPSELSSLPSPTR